MSVPDKSANLGNDPYIKARVWVNGTVSVGKTEVAGNPVVGVLE